MAENDAVTALPSPTRPLEHVHASRAVSDYIRELIFTGVLRSGDRIPQNEIAEKLGLSRLPVREAVILMERDGLVDTQPRRGAFIAPFDVESIEERFEIYGLLHAYAVERAIRLDQESLAALLRPVVRSLIAAAGDAERFSSAMDEFHRTVNRASGSTRITGLLRPMMRVVPGNFFAEVPASVGNSLAAISKVAEAVEQNQPEVAFVTCREYIARNGALLAADLRAKGIIGHRNEAD
jgi:DNA-binding GntR family transcriptional regulator